MRVWQCRWCNFTCRGWTQGEWFKLCTWCENAAKNCWKYFEGKPWL